MNKQRVLFYGLVLLTLVSLADGILMEDPMSLIVAIFLGFFTDLARVGGERGAPYAGKIGEADHNLIYINALDRAMFRIERDRANGGHLAPINSDLYRRYVRDKWTYALLFSRYQQAKQKYGWK